MSGRFFKNGWHIKIKSCFKEFFILSADRDRNYTFSKLHISVSREDYPKIKHTIAKLLMSETNLHFKYTIPQNIENRIKKEQTLDDIILSRQHRLLNGTQFTIYLYTKEDVMCFENILGKLEEILSDCKPGKIEESEEKLTDYISFRQDRLFDWMFTHKAEITNNEIEALEGRPTIVLGKTPHIFYLNGKEKKETRIDLPLKIVPELKSILTTETTNTYIELTPIQIHAILPLIKDYIVGEYIPAISRKKEAKIKKLRSQQDVNPFNLSLQDIVLKRYQRICIEYIDHLKNGRSKNTKINQQKLEIIENTSKILYVDNLSSKEKIQQFKNELGQEIGKVANQFKWSAHNDTTLMQVLKFLGVTFSLGLAYGTLYGKTKSGAFMEHVGLRSSPSNSTM